MNVTEVYERLAAAASLEGDDAAIRFRATYEPAAGPGSKVSPPTYPVEDRGSPYLFEDRRVHDGARRAVLLDSRQAQANRCEEALAAAVERGEVWIPHLVLEAETHGRRVRMTSLTAPHRSRDAYFRDAEDTQGRPFDESEPGRELAACTPEDATALYRYAPTDLVYGVWDSHRGLRLAARFPRVYTSELVGWEPEEGLRAAGRFDLITSGQQRATVEGRDWTPDPKGKKKLSELGLGAIPPTTRNQRGDPLPGGVTVSEIERLGVLSFPGLARIRLRPDGQAARAGRAVLAALALLGDRLAFGRPGVFLRSGCDLVTTSEELTWVASSGAAERLEFDRAAALELLGYAVARAEEAGLRWHPEPIELRPRPNLQAAIDGAFFAGIEELQEE
ncbi:MAG TPA: type I-U CRISPR-associated RAMP protein Csb1/Cas7u [Actinomycetota bacterium]|nr:type I-U CRISPR-associated RAMP protein Csb1/Cas7u [Actinomycetota bacterium]